MSNRFRNREVLTNEKPASGQKSNLDSIFFFISETTHLAGECTLSQIALEKLTLNKAATDGTRHINLNFYRVHFAHNGQGYYYVMRR